jgi:hypothetical protein
MFLIIAFKMHFRNVILFPFFDFLVKNTSLKHVVKFFFRNKVLFDF